MSATFTDRLVWFWGVGGTCALLIDALWRLIPYALEGVIEHSLTGVQWSVLAGWIPFMAYTEGYRGFQLRFSPRVVARSRYLSRCGNWGLRLGAPFVAMGLFHATRRRMIATWILISGIIVLILLIRQLDQPWRGIVDAGVVVGLGWGLIATLWAAGRDLSGQPIAIDLDLPPTQSESQTPPELEMEK